MYGFASGPLVWIAFIVFAAGMVYQFVRLLSLAKKDKVIYPYMSLKYGLRSLFHWVIPFGSKNMRSRYEVTIMTFIFHICLLLLPIFLTAHIVMFAFSWGPRWATLPGSTATSMTILIILAAIFLSGTSPDDAGSTVCHFPFRLYSAGNRSGSLCYRIHGESAVVRLRNNACYPYNRRCGYADGHTVYEIEPHALFPFHQGVHGVRIRSCSARKRLVRAKSTVRPRSRCQNCSDGMSKPSAIGVA